MKLYDSFLNLLKIRFVRFLLVGGINTLFGYSIFALFITLGFRYPVALVFSPILGVLFNYRTIGKLVFSQHSFDVIVLLKFIMVYTVNYFLNRFAISLVLLIVDNVYIAGLIVILPVAVLTYLLNKFIVFSKKDPPHDAE